MTVIDNCVFNRNNIRFQLYFFAWLLDLCGLYIGGCTGTASDSQELLHFGHVIWLPLKLSSHGTSKPPWGRSPEKHLVPVIVQWMVPFLHKNREQAVEIFHKTWPMTVPLCITATAYGSLLLPLSRLHGNTSPTSASMSAWKRDVLEHSFLYTAQPPYLHFQHLNWTFELGGAFGLRIRCVTITYEIIARKNKTAKLKSANGIGDWSPKLNSRHIFRLYGMLFGRLKEQIV